MFKFNITSVEIEPEMVRVARDWFGFVEDERQRAIVMDGAKVVEMAVEEGSRGFALKIRIKGVLIEGQWTFSFATQKDF